MIIRKSLAEIEVMARAGAVVARANMAVRDALRPGMTTADLDRIAEEVIVGEGAIPSFKGYTGSRRRCAPRATTRSCTASRPPT